MLRCVMFSCRSVFFFFQAEDGIRVTSVTGVRRVLFRSPERVGAGDELLEQLEQLVAGADTLGVVAKLRAMAADPRRTRSEERRVGKECRSPSAAAQQEHYQLQGGDERPDGHDQRVQSQR